MAEDNTKSVTLSDGKVAKITEATGKVAKRALMESEGKGEDFLFLYMAKCVTIDDKPVVPEDLEALKGKDFIAIQTAFAELNF